MPNIGAFHPQIVHFVVVLLIIGVLFRLLSFVIRRPFVNQVAMLSLIAGTIAAVVAVRSGTDAHGAVERVPGVREAVMEHEELGQKARNIFLGVAVLELGVFGLARKPDTARFVRWAQVGSALVGLVGVAVLYEAAEHGGDLVYAYAGGPGVRSGKPEDIERLLIAGLFNEARVSRQAGRPDEAARLTEELIRQAPQNAEVRLLQVESLILDRKDARSALAVADSISIEPRDTRLLARKANLKADAFLALGQRDSARAVIGAAVAAVPQNARLKARLDSIR
ncbi:MAG TPA: DUF2231 domain-containing protein [Gemmatimonadaceae bacterium]